MIQNSNDELRLMERARNGDPDAISDLLHCHQSRLKKMVKTRLNPRLRGRVDDSDVMQETYLEAAKRLPEYLAAPRASFFLWLRQITGHKIVDVHRRHLGARRATSAGSCRWIAVDGRWRLPSASQHSFLAA